MQDRTVTTSRVIATTHQLHASTMWTRSLVIRRRADVQWPNTAVCKKYEVCELLRLTAADTGKTAQTLRPTYGRRSCELNPNQGNSESRKGYKGSGRRSGSVRDPLFLAIIPKGERITNRNGSHWFGIVAGGAGVRTSTSSCTKMFRPPDSTMPLLSVFVSVGEQIDLCGFRKWQTDVYDADGSYESVAPRIDVWKSC